MNDTFNIDDLKALRIEQHRVTDRHVLLSESQWEQVIQRIAELEAACEKAEYELDWHSDELRKLEAEGQLFNNTFDAQQMIIEELRAENQRLREAANRVLYVLLPGKVVHMGHEHVRYSATYSIAGWNPVLELQALLGGGE